MVVIVWKGTKQKIDIAANIQRTFSASVRNGTFQARRWRPPYKLPKPSNPPKYDRLCGLEATFADLVMPMVFFYSTKGGFDLFY